MKKFTYLATMLLVMAGAVSCNKNAEVKEPEKEAQPTGVMRQVTMYADQGAEESSVKGGTITWSEGDKLNVVPTTGEFDAASLNIIGGVGESYGTFEGSIDSGIADDTQLYGWAGGDWSYSGGAFSVNMPDVQTYVENGLAEDAYPSIGTGTINDGISLQNPFGVLCLNVKGETTDAVKSITLTSAENNLAGKFTVNPSNYAVTEGSSQTITLNCATAVALATDGVKFYTVVPAANYADKDLTVTVTKSDDTTFEVKLGATAVTASNATTVDVKDGPAPTTGEAYASAVGGNVKWVQLWKDGPKWAEYNVGATSVEDYGGYYCWGMSKNQDPSEETYKGIEDIQGGDHDTAKNLWGSNWQMPTKEDFDNLLYNCTVVWKSKTESEYGVAGRLYTGKGDYSGNSVFFPAAGYCDYGEVHYAGSHGYYWSSTPSGREDAYRLYFISGSQHVEYNYRYHGFSVRAVLREE